MDLVTLLEHVPALLAHCVWFDDYAGRRCLRLVSKEASRVAMLGIFDYRIELIGEGGHKRVCVARLLRPTRLRCLSVRLLLSDVFNPAVLLEAFFREAGTSLSTITWLSLDYDNTGGSASAAAALTAAMQTLVLACPILNELDIGSCCLPPALLRTLGEVCPSLTTLNIAHAGLSDLPYLQNTLLLLLPSLLPQLHTLDFCACKPDFQILDMSHNDSILDLRLEGFTFRDTKQWLCLPRKLQHLDSGPILVGPPDLDNGGPLLSSLKGMYADLCDNYSPFPLHALAKFLRATAALTELTFHVDEENVAIVVGLTGPHAAANAADLLLLRESANVHGAIKDALLGMSCDAFGPDDMPLPHVVAALPRMAGFTRCQLKGLPPGLLAPLLGMFPDVEEMRLVWGLLDDVELQEVAKCTKLSKLYLSACDRVNSMGLLSLCHSSPTLRYIGLSFCDGLQKGKAMEGCRSLLLKHGLQVEIAISSIEDDSDGDSDG